MDRALSNLSALTCGSQASGGLYDCSGQLPSNLSGTHVLELSAVLSGVEGARSSPLTVRITAATAD